MRAVVTTITATMVLPLYLLFWITDLVYAPEYKWEFLFLRLLVIPMAIIVNILIKKARTLTTAENIGLAYVFALTAIPNVMIYVIADPLTPYYTGMVLVAIGGLGFFPWSKKYFIYVVIATFGPYAVLLATVCAGLVFKVGIFEGLIIVLVIHGVISYVIFSKIESMPAGTIVSKYFQKFKDDDQALD